jgi:uncharacterized protein YbdZ (MbtH family)
VLTNKRARIFASHFKILLIIPDIEIMGSAPSSNSNGGSTRPEEQVVSSRATAEVQRNSVSAANPVAHIQAMPNPPVNASPNRISPQTGNPEPRIIAIASPNAVPISPPGSAVPSVIEGTSFANQPLPRGWEVRTDKFGRPYYLDHVHRKTTFVDPRVPPGWEMQLDPNGRPYFIDHVNKITTWQDPRLPKDWEMQFDQMGRPYFIDHNNKRTTYFDPRVYPDALKPLPHGWEMRLDPNGKPLFIDHLSHPKKTTYERPDKEKKEPIQKESKEEESGESTDAPTSDGEESKKELTDDNSCIICLEKERCVALIPCGHLCLCRDCSGTQTKCPVCRTPIQDLLRTYSV